MYSCAELLAALGPYLENEVSAEARREIEHHLAECSTCKALYDSAHQTVRIVTDSGSFELPASLSDRILKRLRDDN